MSVTNYLTLPRAPWNDRRGTLSPLKAVVLVLLTAPALWYGTAFVLRALGAEPVEALQDQAGRWALRFLFLSLAVTPLRLLWRWNELIKVRRLIGLAALFYALGHFALFLAIQDWVWLKIASEIATRIYLTIGAAALTGLLVLGLTSTDEAVRRLGPARWQSLHRLAYGIALLATVHFFLQTRLDPTEAMVMCGLLGWLLAVRAWRWRGATLDARSALVLAVIMTLATAFGEALFFHLRFGVDLQTLLATNFGVVAGIRPAWWVGGILLPVALVAYARRRPASALGRRRRQSVSIGSLR